MIDVKSVLGRNGMKIEFGKQVTMKILTHNLSSKYRDIRVKTFFWKLAELFLVILT